MKKLILTLICLSFTAPAFAEKEGKDHPCRKIKEACEAAGYKKGGHKDGGKGLHVDCMKKLREGQTVEGVNVSAEDLAACKEKAAEHMAKKSRNNAQKKEAVKGSAE